MESTVALRRSTVMNMENSNAASTSTGADSNVGSELMTKTPRTSKKPLLSNAMNRRALGDISNRKLQQPTHFASTSHKSTGSSAKPTPLVVKLGRRLEQAASSTSILPKQQQQQQQLHSSSLPVPVVPNRDRRVALVVHKDQEAAIETRAIQPHRSNIEVELDVERPAGRTWDQQYQNGDHDDDSDQLNVSLEGATTFRQEWSDALRVMQDERIREMYVEIPYDEKQAAKTFQAIHQDDLDCLVAFDTAAFSHDEFESNEDTGSTALDCNAYDWSLDNDESIHNDIRLLNIHLDNVSW